MGTGWYTFYNRWSVTMLHLQDSTNICQFDHPNDGPDLFASEAPVQSDSGSRMSVPLDERGVPHVKAMPNRHHGS